MLEEKNEFQIWKSLPVFKLSTSNPCFVISMQLRPLNMHALAKIKSENLFDFL